MGSPGLAIRRPHYTPAAPPQVPHCVRGDIQQGEWALFRILLAPQPPQILTNRRVQRDAGHFITQ